jgi:hypothetical protein
VGLVHLLNCRGITWVCWDLLVKLLGELGIVLTLPLLRLLVLLLRNPDQLLVPLCITRHRSVPGGINFIRRTAGYIMQVKHVFSTGPHARPHLAYSCLPSICAHLVRRMPGLAIQELDPRRHDPPRWPVTWKGKGSVSIQNSRSCLAQSLKPHAFARLQAEAKHLQAWPSTLLI